MACHPPPSAKQRQVAANRGWLAVALTSDAAYPVPEILILDIRGPYEEAEQAVGDTPKPVISELASQQRVATTRATFA